MPQFVLFETGGIQFGLEQRFISRVEPMNSAVRELKNPDLRNCIGFAGEYYHLIDFSKALGKNVAIPDFRDADVILLNGNTGLSLLADKVGETLEAGPEHLHELPPVFTGNACVCIQKVLRMEDMMALIIDVNGLETIRPIMQLSPTELGGARKTDGKGLDSDSPTQNAPAMPLGPNRLEAVLIEKLSHMIGQQVDQVMSRTITDVVEQHRTKTK